MNVYVNSRFHVFCLRYTGLLLEEEEAQITKSKSPWKGRGCLQMTMEPAQSSELSQKRKKERKKKLYRVSLNFILTMFIRIGGR